MNKQSLDVIYKFSLVALLLASLVAVLVSGIGLMLKFEPQLLRHFHFTAAFLLCCALFLHIFNRKSKLLKIKTQFADLIFRNKYPSYCNLERLIASVESQSLSQICERFQLDEVAFTQKLAQARIAISDSQQPLRQLYPYNDEKIFAIISIALQSTFKPNQ